MLFEQFPVHPRLRIEPFRMGQGHQLNEILVPDGVFTQQHQMVSLVVKPMYLVEPGAGRHVDLAADDRLDPVFFAGPVKVHRAVHHAMVGDGHRLLPQGGGALG